MVSTTSALTGGFVDDQTGGSTSSFIKDDRGVFGVLGLKGVTGDVTETAAEAGDETGDICGILPT